MSTEVEQESKYGPCYICGGPVGTFANGFGSYSGPRTNGETVYLCHPNNPALPDCYTDFCRASSWADLGAMLGIDLSKLRRVEVVDERPDQPS